MAGLSVKIRCGLVILNQVYAISLLCILENKKSKSMPHY